MSKTSKKVTASTAVAIANEEVPNVLQLLDEKLKGLKAITECSYRTSGNLDGFGDIKSETKVENLIRAFSSVRGRENAYNAAAEELGLTDFPVFSVNGGNAEDWKQDILLRKAVIEHKETHDKLTEFKTKMTKFLSEEDQKKMLAAEMAAFLKGLPK